MRAKAKMDDKEQVKRFNQAVKELGADESEERFQDALRKVAKHKPAPDPDKKD